MNSFFQCCYTNKTVSNGDTFSSGWETVSVSSDIPDKVLETCKKIHIIDSSITSEMVDEYGKILKLEEGYGDGDFFYITKTQYGLTDRTGRPNMFSHTFVFPLRSLEFNPNEYLTLDDINFKDNEETANSIPVQLVKYEPFTLSEAMSACGLDLSKYITLIECIYARCVEKVSLSPLYVEYDGTEKNMRSLLYCIYCGVILFVRRNLSYASCETPNTNNQDIIFTINAKNKDYYVIPKTGENNILSPRLEKKLARYGFVEQGVKFLVENEQTKYFSALEDFTNKLGDNTGADRLLLKIANKLLGDMDLSKLSNDELENQLSDALRTESVGNPYIDNYIFDLSMEYRSRKLVLPNEMQKALSSRIIRKSNIDYPTFNNEAESVTFSDAEVQQIDFETDWKPLYEQIDEIRSSIDELKAKANELYSSQLSVAKEKRLSDNDVETINKKFAGLISKINSLTNQ